MRAVLVDNETGDQERYQIRVQERRVVAAEAMQHGVIVARAMAICNPTDEFDLTYGEGLALYRLGDVLASQHAERKIKRRLQQEHEQRLARNGRILYAAFTLFLLALILAAVFLGSFKP